ncbi:hypothetical protein SprV_0702333400 [Sparganum proliferum]
MPTYPIANYFLQISFCSPRLKTRYGGILPRVAPPEDCHDDKIQEKPTRAMTGPDKTSIKFYEDMHALLTPLLKVDKLIVQGDHNAPVRTDCAAWGEGVLAALGIGG